MSSAVGPSVLSSISTSNSFPLETEQNFDEEEEYMSLLTSCQHFVESNIEEDEEKDTRNVRKGRRKPVKTVQLPPTPNFEHFVHPKPLHRAFINLPPNYEANFSKLINLFLLFFPNSILDTIVVNTNLYALTKDASAVSRKWQNIDRKELIIWIALVIYQGLFKLPSLNQYWNEDLKFPIHHISKQMSLKRFEQIKRYLHISPPMATINNYFEKLEPLLSKIRDVSKQLYTSSLNVSVDEMMVRFSGRSIHTIRIKNKPTPEGFKILFLYESGYTYTFLPTSRVSPNNITRMNGLNQTGCLVHHLVTQLPYQQFSYNIYMDNYFSNVPLFQYLRQIGIGTYETI